MSLGPTFAESFLAEVAQILARLDRTSGEKAA